MSIKLIAVDIDGTLVNSKKEITPEVFAAIQDAKAAGVKVIGLKDAQYTFEREDYGESLGARCARETVRVKDDAPIFNPVEIKISCYVSTTWEIELLPPDDLL